MVKPFPGRYLAYLLQQAVERIARLRLFLRDIEYRATKTDQPLIDFFRDRVQAGMSALEEPLSGLNDVLAGTIPLDERRLKMYLGSLWDFNAWFRILHFQFRLFVSLPKVEPEVYVFLEDFFSRDAMSLDWAVVYYYHHNFGELDLLEYFHKQLGDLSSSIDHQRQAPGQSGGGKEKTKVTLLLPYVARNDPLMWTNLLHEMAHACEKRFRVGDEVLGTIKGSGEGLELTRRWVIEYFADVLSLRLAGPAYLCGFINWVLSQTPAHLGPTPTHPSPLRRAGFMNRQLQQLHLHTSSSKMLCDILERIGSLYRPPSDPLPDPVVPEPQIMSEVTRICDQSLEKHKFTRFVATDHKAISPLRRLFETGLPISSRDLNDDRTIRHAVNRLLRKRLATRDDFYAAAAQFEQIPNHPSIILNVGWENRTGKLLDVFSDTFGNRAKIDDCVTSYGENVENCDIKIQRSIETRADPSPLADRQTRAG